MIKYLAIVALSLSSAIPRFDQYDNYVEVKTSAVDHESFGIIKMSRKDNHIKVKYFAAKDDNGTSVYERYRKWSANKKIVVVSSGTYMDNCDQSNFAKPIGLCIDQGNVVNQQLIQDKLDALAIVYATGGIVASDLKEGALTITYTDKTQKKVDIRNNAYDKAEFLNWARDAEATVFQTHLFVYKDVKKIAANSSDKQQERRFLAVCKDDGGGINYYVINLPTASSLYSGVEKAYKILKGIEDVNQIVFMINLDTGCQNVLTVNNSESVAYTSSYLKGMTDISNAVNLLAFYYE